MDLTQGAKLLRQHKTDAELTDQDIAWQLRTRQQNVSNWLNARSTPDLLHALKMHALYGIDPTAWLTAPEAGELAVTKERYAAGAEPPVFPGYSRARRSTASAEASR